MLPAPYSANFHPTHRRAHTLAATPVMNVPLSYNTPMVAPPPYTVVAPPPAPMVPVMASMPPPVVQFPVPAQMSYIPPQPIHFPQEPTHRRQLPVHHSAQGRRPRGFSSARRPQMITSENIPFPVDRTPIGYGDERFDPRALRGLHGRHVSFSHGQGRLQVPTPPEVPIIPGITVPQVAPHSGRLSMSRQAPAHAASYSLTRSTRRLSLPAQPRAHAYGTPFGNATNSARHGREWIHVSELGWLDGMYEPQTNKLRKRRL